jgi:hypothetical protein
VGTQAAQRIRPGRIGPALRLVVALAFVLQTLTARVVNWYVVVVGVAAAACMVLVMTWFAVVLRPDALVIQHVRRRRIPWDQVQAVVQEQAGGRRRVTLWVSGECILLPYPSDPRGVIGRMFGRSEPRFEEAFALIRQWYGTHRG